MARPTQGTALPAALRRRLDLAAAVARKRLMEIHLQHAMEMVERTDGELEPRRALDIYTRLHKLSPADAANVEQEVYVALGRRILPRPIEEEAEGEEVRWEDPDSTLRQIRRRLRGRVNLELRSWVEFHTGRAETALFWTHVENADEFVDLLEDHRGISEAVAIYAERVGLSPSWSELIYFMLLEQRGPVGRGSAAQAGVRRSWRTVEARGGRGQRGEVRRVGS